MILMCPWKSILPTTSLRKLRHCEHHLLMKITILSKEISGEIQYLEIQGLGISWQGRLEWIWSPVFESTDQLSWVMTSEISWWIILVSDSICLDLDVKCSPTGSFVCSLGPQQVALFLQTIESSGIGTYMEDVVHLRNSLESCR